MGTRILLAILAAGVITAGLVLWSVCSSRRTLRHIRWAIAALTAYGAGSFVAASILGIGLRAALSGEGPVHGLPYFLQGGFLGGFLVLPLGWIASVIRLGVRRFRERAPHPVWYQAVALTTCVALLFTTLEIRGSDENHLDPKARVALLDKSVRALEDGDRAIPRDTWDPDYVVGMVGRDPQRLFAWVRDNTFWIPYQGVLRGAVGVLMDRRGNSLDRAILLARLLERAGYSVRLANGDLPQDLARQLLVPLVAATNQAAHAADEPPDSPDQYLQTIAARYALDNSPLHETLASIQEAAGRISSQLKSRVDDQSRRLMQVVSRPDARIEWSQRYDTALAALRDHWWVQLQQAGAWTDLDLLQNELKPATALVSSKRTLAVTELPADLHHEIAIRVVAEQSSQGSLNEHKVLEFSIRPSEVIGKPIVLRFWPTAWMPDSGLNYIPSTDFRESVLKQDRWGVAVAVDSKVAAAGILLATGDDPNAPLKGGLLGGIAGAFGASIGVSPATGDKSRQLTAVWIEYQIHVPGSEARKLRRSVFDLIGPAARSSGNRTLTMSDRNKLARGLALLMRSEILPISCRFSPEFLMHLAARSLIGNHDLIDSSIRGDFQPGTPSTDALLQQSTPVVSRLYSLAEARIEWARDSSPLFVSEPQLLTSHSYAAVAGERILLRYANDIVANQFGVSLSVQDGFAKRLEQGVRDTNAEAILRFRGIPFGNASEAYANSGAWVHVSHKAVATLQLPADSLRNIANDLASGYDVVAPSAGIPIADDNFYGWWRIDRSTGSTLGIGANGWGQGGEEARLDLNAAVQEPRWIQMSRAGWEGFSTDYSFCVALKMAQELDGPATYFQERLVAVAVASPRECGKHALVWGIVSAVLPLFIAGIGKVISKWFPRIAPGLFRAGRWLAGHGKPILGGGEEPPVVGPPSAGGGPPEGGGNGPQGPRNGPKGKGPKNSPSGGSPSQDPSSSSDPGAPPPKSENPCEDLQMEVSEAATSVNPPPPSPPAAPSPYQYKGPSPKMPYWSIEQIEQNLQVATQANAEATATYEAASQAEAAAQKAADAANDRLQAAAEEARFRMGDNYQDDPAYRAAATENGRAQVELANAKDEAFLAGKARWIAANQQAHWQGMGAPTASLLQAQQQMDVESQQAVEFLKKWGSDPAAFSSCQPGSDLYNQIMAHNREASAISDQYNQALEEYWKALTTPRGSWDEVAPTQVDPFGNTQPKFPNGSPGDTPPASPNRSPSGTPSGQQSGPTSPQGTPSNPPANGTQQSSAAQSVPPPPPNPLANSIVGMTSAINALGNP